MCARKFVEEAHKAFARVEEYADHLDGSRAPKGGSRGCKRFCNDFLDGSHLHPGCHSWLSDEKQASHFASSSSFLFFSEKLQELESDCVGSKYSKSFFDPQSTFLYLHGIFILLHQCDCEVLLYNFCKHSLWFDENIRNDLGRVDILVWCMFCCNYMGKDMQGGSTFSTGHGKILGTLNCCSLVEAKTQLNC